MLYGNMYICINIFHKHMLYGPMLNHIGRIFSILEDTLKPLKNHNNMVPRDSMGIFKWAPITKILIFLDSFSAE